MAQGYDLELPQVGERPPALPPQGHVRGAAGPFARPFHKIVRNRTHGGLPARVSSVLAAPAERGPCEVQGFTGGSSAPGTDRVDPAERYGFGRVHPVAFRSSWLPVVKQAGIW